MNILVVEGSTRHPSSTLTHVEALLSAQNSPHTSHIVRLATANLPAFVDARAFGTWQSTPELEEILDRLLSSDLLILASPLYWYSVSAPMKNFIDHWSYFLRQPRAGDFLKGKPILPLIVASEGATAEETAPVFNMLKLSADYVEARALPGFLGEGDREGQAGADSLERMRLLDLQKLVTASP